MRLTPGEERVRVFRVLVYMTVEDMISGYSGDVLLPNLLFLYFFARFLCSTSCYLIYKAKQHILPEPTITLVVSPVEPWGNEERARRQMFALSKSGSERSSKKKSNKIRCLKTCKQLLI